MSLRSLSAIVLSVVFANAAIAADAPIPIAAFVKQDKFTEPRLSPDGKHLE